MPFIQYSLAQASAASRSRCSFMWSALANKWDEPRSHVHFGALPIKVQRNKTKRLFFLAACFRQLVRASCIIAITFEAIPTWIVVHKKRKTGIAVRRTLFFHNLEAGEHKNRREKKSHKSKHSGQIKLITPVDTRHA